MSTHVAGGLAKLLTGPKTDGQPQTPNLELRLEAANPDDKPDNPEETSDDSYMESSPESPRVNPDELLFGNGQIKREKKNGTPLSPVLKELGCRLKSLIYQKGQVSRKDILKYFRKKEDLPAQLGKRKPKVVLPPQSSENNWRRRIYDALNVLQNSGAVDMDALSIKIPQSKSNPHSPENLCGLLVLREHCYRNLFLLKNSITKHQQLLREKQSEKDFLEKQALAHKAGDVLQLQTKLEEAFNIKLECKQDSQLEDGLQAVREGRALVTTDPLPPQYALPFYLVPHTDGQHFSLDSISPGKLLLKSNKEMRFEPYYRVIK